MISRVFSCSFSLILVFCFVPGFAQTSTNTAAPASTGAQANPAPTMPKDPKDLMLLAGQVNGLSSMGAQPWHVKANYQTFDADGKPKDQGVFEEWWVGPEKYKVSYTSRGFNQVLYHDGEKSLVSGDTGWAPQPQAMVEEYLVHPFPDARVIAKGSYTEDNRKIGNVKLKCVQPRHSSSLRAGQLADYCLASNIPAIRIENFHGGFYVLFDKIVSFGGHYVAEQITARNSGSPIVEMSVDSLEFPTEISDDVFVPLGKVSPLESVKSVIAGKKMGGEDPHYPAMAKERRVQGMVMLDAKITKTGTIDDLRVVSGPKELRQSALDAVKTWKYKPYLRNGKPVEVRMEISVIYTIGG